NMLRQVQSDRSNLAHGWLPFAAVSIRQQFGTQMPQGGHPPHHSITSLARVNSDGGTSRPRALAILWLITSSYFTLIDPTQQTTSLLDHRVLKPRISRNAISAKSCSRSRSEPSRVRGRVSSKHKVPMQLPSSSFKG